MWFIIASVYCNNYACVYTSDVLQCIYVSLDEPDGVAGVAAIRREDPSLEEQVIQHEATGISLKFLMVLTVFGMGEHFQKQATIYLTLCLSLYNNSIV